MTGVEAAVERLIQKYCPADRGIETEMSIPCREDDRSKEELYREGICEMCWKSELRRNNE